MIVTGIVFFVILSILVLIHELGHFVAAKKLGIKVEEFGFGLPPRLFGYKYGETIYSINALPIGGFVRLFGEDLDSQERLKTIPQKEKKRTFYARPVWQRVIVVTAGVAMNFFLALIIISYMFSRGVSVPTENIHIESVTANSPAEEIGLLEGDIIEKLETADKENKSEVIIKESSQLVDFTGKHLGEELLILFYLYE